jgi:catabolite regulation protein CreA
VVDAYDDRGRRRDLHVSRAKTGGIKGGLGLAEDKAVDRLPPRPARSALRSHY